MTAGCVLIVDDRENWRSQLCLILKEEGYEVEAADSYAIALQALQRKEFQLVVVDVRLVDADELNIDGLRLIATIQEYRWPTAIIILTGYRSADYEADPVLNSQQIRAFLHKREFDINQLLELIAESIKAPKEHW